jgi:Protein of unknown function (DUF2721)
MLLHELIPILQIAVIPAILISGVGLIMLSLTNRFGRIADRSRQLLVELRSVHSAGRDILLLEIRILSNRALALRLAIALATVSQLFAAVLIITIFLGAFLNWRAGLIVVILFVGSLVFLIGALIAFLRDVNLSLAALRLELPSKDQTE